MERNARQFDELRLEAWYESLQNEHPFNLEVKSRNPEDSKAYRAISVFPWDKASLNTLWHGEFASESNNASRWNEICEKWSGIVAVGGGSKIHLFLTRPEQKYLPVLKIEVPSVFSSYRGRKENKEAGVTCVAWCMVHNADGFWPLVAFSSSCILYLYNVERGNFHGVLRGHGGEITSLAVHPVDPSILASTSYDYTCRIYDLTKRVECKLDNPCWPGKTKMSLAGAPFGLRANESEGYDYGRCTAVLAGGPSGGHLAPVLCAAFHPSYPIIATGGMDHAVKLWRLPMTIGDRISREDKPVFSSANIHGAQVLSITWMSKDMLLSNCGEVLLRKEPKLILESPDILERVPGTLVLWKWLGLDRFFPPDRDTWPAMLRGCSSDYQDSSSYKVIAEYNLPCLRLSTGRQLSARAFVFEASAHTPLIALPSYGCVFLSSVQHFKPRPPQHWSKAGILGMNKDEASANDLVAATLRLSLNSDDEKTTAGRGCWVVEMENGVRKRNLGDAEGKLPKLEACAIAEDGRLLVGVGENEGIWIWRIPQGKQVRRDLVSVERQ